MFLNDKKKAAQFIISREHKDGSHSQHMSEGGMVGHDSEDETGLHQACQEMMDAVTNKSPQDMHRALSSYIELHKQLPSGEDVPSDDKSENEEGEETSQMHYNRG